MNIAILALQGDVSEHRIAIKKAMKNLKIDGKIFEIKNFENFDYDLLIIPGGESTAMRILGKDLLYKFLKKVKEKDISIVGTCAGLIILSKNVDGNFYDSLLDIEVERNAYGRQKDSFETEIEFKFNNKLERINAVFIRAPIIKKVNRGEILAKFNNDPVAIRDGKIFGFTFHLELSENRIYEYILSTI